MIYTARYTARRKNTAGTVYLKWGLETIKRTETVARNSSVTLAPSQTKAGSFALNHGRVDKTLLTTLLT